MSSSDIVLLKRWQHTHDADAFAELVTRHASMVYATCRRVLRNATEAEDVAQECFIALMQAKVTARDSLAPWLHTVAVRRSLDVLRAAKRRIAREEKIAPSGTTTPDMVQEELFRHVDEAIEALPEESRALIVERFLRGQKHSALAAQFHLQESTVRYRIDKAVEILRKNIKQRGVTISAAILASTLTEEMAMAAPERLVANLGRTVLSGNIPVSPTASLPGKFWIPTLTKATILLMVLGGVFFGGYTFMQPDQPTSVSGYVEVRPAPPMPK